MIIRNGLLFSLRRHFCLLLLSRRENMAKRRPGDLFPVTPQKYFRSAWNKCRRIIAEYNCNWVCHNETLFLRVYLQDGSRVGGHAQLHRAAIFIRGRRRFNRGGHHPLHHTPHKQRGRRAAAASPTLGRAAVLLLLLRGGRLGFESLLLQ